jgi:hypothetical protein
VSKRETVKKAAKLAVYEAIMIKPKSHHVAATKRPSRGGNIKIKPHIINKNKSVKKFTAKIFRCLAYRLMIMEKKEKREN